MKHVIENTLKEYISRTRKNLEPIYIGITGYARSGKDTVADILEEILPHSYKMSLATSMKHGLTELIGDFPGFFTEEKHLVAPFFGKATYREVLISFGDWARSYNEDIFVDILKERSNLTGSCVIVPDVRRLNEVQHMDFLIRVTRPGVGPGANHPTEGELDGYPEDFLIENDGNLTDLEAKVKQVVG